MEKDAVAAPKPTVWEQVTRLKPNFWFANWMEANERLAFFGVRAIAPLYMIASIANHGLALSYGEKGVIFSVWALVQCLVPMVSGGFTDSYGYKKSLAVAFGINIVGYVLFANASDFWTALAAACCIGLGTAIFKPPVAGTIARASTQDNSSIAWGIFYWMVNVGGFLAPMAAAIVRGETNWRLVFYCAAGVTAFNFIPMLVFYREPERDPNAPKKSVAETFVTAITTLKDKNFLIFLAIFSGFWLMFMQLWDLFPNFIDEWVTSTDIAPFFRALSASWVLASGNVKPEILINIDSAAIIALMLPIAWLTGKFHPMIALIGGMLISLVGFLIAGTSSIGFVVALGIFIFAIGEMCCSPKFSEYIGLTAPADKKALYMGYSNIPFAVGWSLGNWISGGLYDKLGSKVHLAQQYLVQQAHLNPAEVKGLSQDSVMTVMARTLHGGQGGSVDEATKLLWNAHHPWIVWVILGGIGAVSTVAMLWYYLKSRGRVKTA